MRSGKEAAQVFRAKDFNKVGKCLYEVQAAFASGHRYPSAIAQWHAAKHKHYGDRTPPIGAPMYFSGGNYGHIAIYVGNGKVRSTDVGGAGRMGTASIEWFRIHWGYSYLGWTGDIADRDIDFVDHIDVYLRKLKPGVDNSDSVRMLRRTLIRRKFLRVQKPLSAERPGNKYTPAVERAVSLWQRKHGYKPTGVFTYQQAREYFAPNKRVRVHA